MKVGIVTGLHKPAEPPFAGGVEASSWQLGSYISQQRPGWEINYYTTGNTAPAGCNLRDYKIAAGKNVFEYEDILAGMVLSDSDDDVIINLSNISSFIVANAMKIGPPQVFWLQLGPHGWVPFSRMLHQYARMPGTDLAIMFQSHTHYNSFTSIHLPFEMRILENERISIASMPVDPAFYTELPQSVIERRKTNPRFAFIGRATKEKGVQQFFRIAHDCKKLGSFHMYVPEVTEELNKISSYYDPGTVMIHVARAYTIIMFELMHTTAVILPFQNVFEVGAPVEPGTRVIKEALLSGVPVVGPRAGCFAEWVKEDHSGFLYGDEDTYKAVDHRIGMTSQLDPRLIQQRAFDLFNYDDTMDQIDRAFTYAIP